MPRRTQMLIAASAALVCMAWSSPAFAEEDEPVTPPAAPHAAAPPAFAKLQALDERALARTRGGADAFNDMKLKGVVADNQAINLSTGNNSLTDGAFTGATGLATVIQNSGNNVLIQNATIVNVHVK
jgi:hypothetical protein